MLLNYGIVYSDLDLDKFWEILLKNFLRYFFINIIRGYRNLNNCVFEI